MNREDRKKQAAFVALLATINVFLFIYLIATNNVSDWYEFLILPLGLFLSEYNIIAFFVRLPMGMRNLGAKKDDHLARILILVASIFILSWFSYDIVQML